MFAPKDKDSNTSKSQKAAGGDTNLTAPSSFQDNRPIAQLQQKMQALANSSEQVQQQAIIQKMANDSGANQAMSSKNGSKKSLPDGLKSGVEQLSGFSMDDVQVHYNSAQPDQINAHAYAQGSDIFLGTGQKKHLPHEAWHVVQQKQGRVAPTQQLKGKTAVNTDSNLEKEADIMGSKAISLSSNIASGAAEDQPTKPTTSIIQGYFKFGNQKTTDQDIFSPDSTDQEKRNIIWEGYILPHLPEGLDASDVEEFKGKLLNMALDSKKYNFSKYTRLMQRTLLERAENALPLEERTSPDALLSLVSTTPDLSGKEKHSTATYLRRSEEDDEPTRESFNSDSYTKGPSRRDRNRGPVTTPKGDIEQTWTADDVKMSIAKWNCEYPLARHLASTIWPLIQNDDEGKQWELKFREMDRLIEFRETEGQSAHIAIYDSRTNEHYVTVNRIDYTKDARKLLRKAILDDEPHPVNQSSVPFYDQLLKQRMDDDIQEDDGTGMFKLNRNYMATGSGLSMILTHWRPILYFDWILAEDVMNNAITPAEDVDNDNNVE